MEWLDVAKAMGPVIGGGAVGALLTQWFRNRSVKTREIQLIERVNREQDQLRGIRLVRSSSAGQEREVKNIRSCQMTLRNTSGQHLRDDQVQFEFSSEDVEPWVSRPARSKTALVPVEAFLTPPWKTTLRWQIPSLPPGDSVEFSFQVFEPTTEEYEAVLYSNANVVLRKVKGEPEVYASPPAACPLPVLAVGLLVVMFMAIPIVNKLLSRAPAGNTRTELLRKASKALDEAEQAPSERDRSRKMQEAVRSLVEVISDLESGPPAIPPTTPP